MKILTRILLVNWYLFDAEAINVKGNLLVVGPTGAGKTSLLDAIQTVLLGGHGKHIKLNANATDKSARNLRGYCLGLIRTEDKNNNTASSIREDAITHLSLVFEEEKTGEEITIGVCLSAKRFESTHRVEGLYILPKQALGLEIFLDQDNAPISWKHLREEFKRITDLEQGNELYLYGHQPQKYIEQLCLSMSPKNRFIDYQKYVRSLQKAINLQDVENVSDFVKHFILDDDPIDIARMEHSIKTYQELLESAKKAESQIKILSTISKQFKKSFNAKKRSIAYQWIQQEFLLQEKDLEKEELEKELISICQNVKSAIGSIRSCEKQQRFHEKEKDRLIQLIAKDNKEQELNKLEGERRGIERDIFKLKAIIDKFAQILEKTADLAIYKAILPEVFSEIVQDLAQQLFIDSSHSQVLELTEWPEDPANFDRVVILLQNLAPTAKKEVAVYRDDLLIQKNQIENNFREKRQRLDHLKTGGSDIRSNTRMLLAELKQHNIEAIPVCDLVNVHDEAWQPAIEAYLKSNMEALYVDPEDAENAVRIYRNINRQKKIYGATIINTRKTSNWINRKIPTNSCAVFLNSDNEHALAYLQNLLRHVICVETEQDLMAEHRAITKDGMLHRNGGITRLRLPHLFQLGKQARKQTLAILTEQIQKLSKKLTNVESQYKKADAMQDAVNSAVQGLNSITRFTETSEEISHKRNQLEIIKESIGDIDLEHLQVWKSKRDEHQNKKKEVDGLRDKAQKTKISEWEKNKSKRKQVNQLENSIQAIATERSKIASHKIFDAELAIKYSEKLEFLHDDVSSIVSVAKEKESIQSTVYKRQLHKAKNDLLEYRFSQDISQQFPLE